MKRLGVGRTPLRDALHTLAHEGLVEIIPRRGTFVSQVTLSDLQQIFDVRSGIEAIVAQLAVSRVEDSHLEPLQNLVERAKRTEGPESDVGLDSEFHNLLLEIANNRYLSEMYRPLADASVRLLYLTRCGMERPEEQVQVFQAALVSRPPEPRPRVPRPCQRVPLQRVGECPGHKVRHLIRTESGMMCSIVTSQRRQPNRSTGSSFMTSGIGNRHGAAGPALIGVPCTSW